MDNFFKDWKERLEAALMEADAYLWGRIQHGSWGSPGEAAKAVSAMRDIERAREKVAALERHPEDELDRIMDRKAKEPNGALLVNKATGEIRDSLGAIGAKEG